MTNSVEGAQAALPCPKCGGERILAEGGPSVAFRRRPFSLGDRFARKPPVTHVDAIVCGVCGYTELYARAPEQLR